MNYTEESEMSEKSERCSSPFCPPHPRVEILGWSNSDGTFALVLGAINPDGTRDLDKPHTYFTVDRADWNGGIDNLSNWFHEHDAPEKIK